MKERLDRAIAQLRDHGVTVATRDVSTIVVGAGEEYVLAMQGTKDLHHDFGEGGRGRADVSPFQTVRIAQSFRLDETVKRGLFSKPF